MGFVKSDQLIELFHGCLSVDERGNESDCFHPSLFHCPNTSKCISKQRLVDGVKDCYDGADETYADSCRLNDTHRFRCSSEDKCLSPVLMHDMVNDCRGGEDELRDFKHKLSFQHLCDGYTHLLAELIDGQNETDETNCEQWPCDNQYTRCDKAWTCANGTDEVNCNPASPCYPNHHQCISPINFTLMCLPTNLAGNGKVDCLGATDEREHCRRAHPENPFKRYRCLNDTQCTLVECSELDKCPFEQNSSIKEICQGNGNFKLMFESLITDIHLGSTLYRTEKYFMLDPTSRFSLNASLTRSSITQESLPTTIDHSSDLDATFSSSILTEKMDSRQAWICNRGIWIFVGIEKTEHCLCPPSYYGNRCQFQNERISLTLQFSKECSPICRGLYGIVVTLIDDDHIIHSYEQLTYIPTKNCDIKLNIYLLYRSRLKDLRKNYTIHIDAYNKINLVYHSSWMLPVKFLFLPVNRIAAHLRIPTQPVEMFDNCPLVCGDHGHCMTYINNPEYFCHCDPRWSGAHCTIRLDDCDCSPDSFCLGRVNNRSICFCPLHKSGPRCFLRSVCEDIPCKNGGQCIQEDHQLSINLFTCICSAGFSGMTCNESDTRIDISFDGVEVPQSLLIHLITVQKNDKPLITTISKKIGFDQDSAILYTSVLFNLIFVEILSKSYLAFLQMNSSHVPHHIVLEMKSFDHCSSIDQLLDERTLAFPLLRRVKSYHVACQKHSQLSCFYDKEAFLCLCNKDGYANCFAFHLNATSTCPGRTICENGGQCLQDRASCPTLTMCICDECFYGGKCQFTTKSFGLSLDVILRYQVRSHVPIGRQPAVVKVSIVLTMLMLVIGLINGFLSGMTFQSKSLREYGCGLYLFILSLVSVLSATMLTLKFWFLFLSQTSWIQNRAFLWVYCISMDFILQSFLTIGDWLSASVAIERAFAATKGLDFDKKKSRKAARWVSVGVLLWTIASLIHDPIHRQLIDDQEEQRTWCVVQYSSNMKIFDSIVDILHFLLPFCINLISALVVIITVARTHSNARKKRTYKKYLREQFYEQKHLFISPIILVLLAVPRLIISFLSGCINSVREPGLFLFGYFISFIPPLLTFIVFIWPSENYKTEFNVIVQRHRIAILRRLHQSLIR